MPPTHQDPTPARARPVTPPKAVSGFGETGIRSRPTPAPTFKLPEKVTQAQIKDQSFKYGGGRSSGNRSLADNFKRRFFQP
jgi:hypothetical protein